jgi:hypothetical protein
VHHKEGVHQMLENQNNDAWIVRLNNPVHLVLEKHLLVAVVVQLLKQRRSLKHRNKKQKMLLTNQS